MKTRMTLALALMSALVLSSHRLWADPLPVRAITFGVYVNELPQSPPFFSLFGDGFSLQGDTHIPTQFGCQPCGPAGKTVSLTYLGEVGSLSGTVDGVVYGNLFTTGSSDLSVSGVFTIPPDAVTGTQISFPFSTLPVESGLDDFRAFTSPSSTTPVFAFSVTGSGTAMGTLRNSAPSGSSPVFDIDNLTWVFSAPSATPEPASLLLVATGVAAIGVQRMRKGRARSSQR